MEELNNTQQNDNSKYVHDLQYMKDNLFKDYTSTPDEHRAYYHSYNDLASKGALNDIQATNDINDVWAKRGSSSARTMAETMKGDGVPLSEFLKSAAGSSITARRSARNAIYDVYGASEEVKKAIEENNLSKAIELAKQDEEKPEVTVLDGEGTDMEGNASVAQDEDVDSLKNLTFDPQYEPYTPDKKVSFFDAIKNGGQMVINGIEQFGKKGADKDSFENFLKTNPTTFAALFKRDNGISREQKIGFLAELLFQADANYNKALYEGFNKMPLSDAKLSPTQERFKDMQKNLDDRTKERFNAENKPRAEQAERFGGIDTLQGFDEWDNQDKQLLASWLPREELSKEGFAEVFYGNTPEKRDVNILKRKGLGPDVLETEPEKARAVIDAYIDETYNSYQTARTMYSQGSQARQNLQAERANAQNIQQKDIDLAYYGAEKDFKVKQDVVNAQAELNQKIQEINALEAEINKAGTIGEFMNVYSAFINMANGIVSVTNTRSTGGNVGASIAIPGMGSISGGFQTTSGTIQNTDAWKQSNQANANKYAAEWSAEFKKMKPTMLKDLEAAKKGYQDRINQLTEFSKKLPDNVSKADPISDYVNGKRGPRDINYYSNMAQGWA